MMYSICSTSTVGKLGRVDISDWVWKQEKQIDVLALGSPDRRGSLFLRLFVLLRPSTDWMRPTHISKAVRFTQVDTQN